MSDPRIPTDLQAVFLAANQGEDVCKPPASKSAFRVFQSAFRAGINKFKVRKDSKAPRSASTSSVSSFPSTVLSDFRDDQPMLQVPSPQAWVQKVLPERGYNTNRINAVSTAYRNEPTDLQLASYNSKAVDLCTRSRLDHVGPLSDMLGCGISLNACNVHGETLMHKACRLGYHHVLQVFIDLGAELRVCDDQGRTLLHEACWGARPSFQTFRLLMLHAPELLLMEDCRGACPLEYVQKSHYEFWLDFLHDNVDRFWPATRDSGLSDRARGKPNTIPIPTPVRGLSCELAQMVASGRMEPEEALFFARTSLESAASSRHESDSTVLTDEESGGEEDSWFELDEGLMDELDDLLAKYGRSRN